MRSIINRLAPLAFVATAVVALLAPRDARAQNLGPFRQFLAIEPYYSRLSLDVDAGDPTADLNGYGGRLWINLAPFSGQHWNLPSHGGIAFYYTYFPEKDGVSVMHYGAQHDLFFTNRPYGGFFDPFLALAGGVMRFKDVSSGESISYGSFSPGGGIRIPIPNRLQLRVDARDAILFNTRGPSGERQARHNLELQGALGITF